MNEQIEPIHFKIVSFHRIVAIIILILLPSIILINEPWVSHYQTPSSHSINFLKLQFNKIDTYYQWIENMIKSVTHISLNKTITPQNFRCQDPTKICNKYVTTEQKFIRKLYKKQKSIQCLQGSCTFLKLFANLFWQYNLIDIGIKTVYVAQNHNSNWNLASYPIIQSLSDNILLLPTIKDQVTIFLLNQQRLFLNKQFVIQNITYKIYIQLDKQYFIDKFSSYVQQFCGNMQNVLITDSQNWIYWLLNSDRLFPPEKYVGEVYYTIPFILYNQTLFEFQITHLQVYSSYFQDLSNVWGWIMYLALLLVFYVFYAESQIIKQYIMKIFQQMDVINKLYMFNINEIFSGKSLNNTIVLEQGQVYEFYSNLSILPEYFVPIQPIPKNQQKLQPFLFDWILKNIQQKYRAYSKPIIEEKNRQIINNKLYIHSSLNEISQHQAKKIKQYYLRCKQLGLIQPFFKFAYLSLLKQPQIYDKILIEDQTPLPQNVIKLFRKINHTIRSNDICEGFKFNQNVLYDTQNQLKIRVQANLMLKYLLILKDLDIHNKFAKLLGLERQLTNLYENIQSLRYLLGKHNKNIKIPHK